MVTAFILWCGIALIIPFAALANLSRGVAAYSRRFDIACWLAFGVWVFAGVLTATVALIVKVNS